MEKEVVCARRCGAVGNLSGRAPSFAYEEGGQWLQLKPVIIRRPTRTQ